MDASLESGFNGSAEGRRFSVFHRTAGTTEVAGRYRPCERSWLLASVETLWQEILTAPESRSSGSGQYLQVLACNAVVEGVGLDAAETPLVQ